MRLPPTSFTSRVGVVVYGQRGELCQSVMYLGLAFHPSILVARPMSVSHWLGFRAEEIENGMCIVSSVAEREGERVGCL